jgi:hypothetical protein
MAASAIVTTIFILLFFIPSIGKSKPYFFERRTANYAKPPQQKNVVEESKPKIKQSIPDDTSQG